MRILIWILRGLALIVGLPLILGGAAGSIWTIWDFIQDFFGNSVIGNLQIIPGTKILLLPHLIVFGLFGGIAVAGGKLFHFGKGLTAE